MSFSFYGVVAEGLLKESPLWTPWKPRFTHFENPINGTLVRFREEASFAPDDSWFAPTLLWSKDNPGVKMVALNYRTWAGLIDCCEGCFIQGGKVSSMFIADNLRSGESVLKSLCGHLGIMLTDDGYFHPFSVIERS